MKPAEKVLAILTIALVVLLICTTVVKAEGVFSVFLPAAFRGGQTVVPSPTPTRVIRGRTSSGVNQSAHFYQGEEVIGVRIVLVNGAVCDGGNCYLQSAPTEGDVTTGVIWPWSSEIPVGIVVWVPVIPTATATSTVSPTDTPIATPTVEDTVEPTATATPERRESGPGQTIIFLKGESVVGYTIELLPSHQKCDGGGCYLSVAPEGGIVTSGVVNPWSTEVEGLTPWVPN